MAESATDLATMLLKLGEEETERLKGLICAAYGLSETILSDAEDRGSVEPAVLGLRQVVTDAEALVAELREKLDTAHQLAREASA